MFNFTSILGLLNDSVRVSAINHHRYVRTLSRAHAWHARTVHGCASKCTHVAQHEDNGLCCGLSNGEVNEVNGRPSPSLCTGWAKAPFSPSHSFFLPSYMCSLANACVMLFLHVDLCSSLSLLLPVSLPLSYTPSVLAADTRWGGTVFLSLSFDFGFRIQRKSATPLSTHISSSVSSSFSSLPSFLGVVHPGPPPVSMHIS